MIGTGHRLEAHGWLFECSLPFTDRDGWHAQRWGGTRLVAVRREHDEPETPAERKAREASGLRIWCEAETSGVDIVPMPSEARWFENIEEMREDATQRLSGVAESWELIFSCWNANENEDETLGFQTVPLENPYAPERITTAFTDRRHVCVYVNGYYAYTLCDGPAEEAGETTALFMNNALPPRSTALAELGHLLTCRCDDNRVKPV